MAKSRGIERPPRVPEKPLPSFPDTDSLPRGVLYTILMSMANRQNWGDVAYAASNITTVEGSLQAHWMSEDSKADVREHFARLNDQQKELVEAAWEGGMAETPPSTHEPAAITLAWVRAHFPPRPSARRR
jgi:hypothetical protein